MEKNKFVLLLTLLIVAIVAKPNDLETTDRIILSDIEGPVVPGSGDTYSFTVSLEGSETLYTAFEIDLTFPEGMSVAYNKSGTARVSMLKSGFYPFTLSEEENDEGEMVEVKEYTHTLTAGMVSSNCLKVIVMSLMNENFTGTSGELFKVYVQASPYLKPGNGGIGVSAKLVTKDEKSYIPAEYTANTLTVGSNSSMTLAVSSDNQFGTCILPFDYTLPVDGSLKAYTCSQCTSEELFLTEVQTRMQAYTPYILYSPSGFSANIGGEVDASKYPESGIVRQGHLVGTIVQKELSESTSYVMQNQGSGPMFYQVGTTPFVLPAGKCYAELPKGSEARVIRMDDATGIIETENGEMENGTDKFDLSGRRVEKLQKGVYIVNGNKVVKQ